jgi:hypothetical protein
MLNPLHHFHFDVAPEISEIHREARHHGCGDNDSRDLKCFHSVALPGVCVHSNLSRTFKFLDQRADRLDGRIDSRLHRIAEPYKAFVTAEYERFAAD